MNEEETKKWAISILKNHPDIMKLLACTTTDKEAETVGKLFARFLLTRGVKMPDNVDFEKGLMFLMEEIRRRKRSEP